jgi:hypothetical protein
MQSNRGDGPGAGADTGSAGGGGGGGVSAGGGGSGGADRQRPMEGATSTARTTPMIATLKARVAEPEAIVIAASKLTRERGYADKTRHELSRCTCDATYGSKKGNATRDLWQLEKLLTFNMEYDLIRGRKLNTSMIVYCKRKTSIWMFFSLCSIFTMSNSGGSTGTQISIGDLEAVEKQLLLFQVVF